MASGAEMSSSPRTKRPFFPKKRYKNIFPDKKIHATLGKKQETP